jgi:glycosyltransferase involved in cell wall biosynthesis
MDLICYCHLRWNFVYQRPQHLMNRFSVHERVFFIEEAVFFENLAESFLDIKKIKDNLWVVTPHLLKNLTPDKIVFQQQVLLSALYNEFAIVNYIHWLYTPMALTVSNHLEPEMIIYDCMDELSNFMFAPAELKQKEKELFGIADIVFTGGHNLYNEKKKYHPNIFPFPSSIDKEHFCKARTIKQVPDDQKLLKAPILGFYGVIDERFNIDLLREVASMKPQWNFVIIGPVVKIDNTILPQLPNIHYLGPKTYEQLPAYLSGWDIALIPFLLNDSTKYISPTKTPEYLAAGVPVISSSIIDVVNPYGTNNLVHIADTPAEFIRAAEKELNVVNKKDWLDNVDLFLRNQSWDHTWRQMMQEISATLRNKKLAKLTNKKKEVYV